MSMKKKQGTVSGISTEWGRGFRFDDTKSECPPISPESRMPPRMLLIGFFRFGNPARLSRREQLFTGRSVQEPLIYNITQFVDANWKTDIILLKNILKSSCSYNKNELSREEGDALVSGILPEATCLLCRIFRQASPEGSSGKNTCKRRKTCEKETTGRIRLYVSIWRLNLEEHNAEVCKGQDFFNGIQRDARIAEFRTEEVHRESQLAGS